MRIVCRDSRRQSALSLDLELQVRCTDMTALWHSEKVGGLALTTLPEGIGFFLVVCPLPRGQKAGLVMTLNHKDVSGH